MKIPNALVLLLVLYLSSCQNNTPTSNNNLKMNTSIALHDETLTIDLAAPIDISLAVKHDAGVGAWYIPQPQITHVEVDGYVGKVSLGGSTNFNDINFNPHSHGTHTECIGHITEDFYSVNKAIQPGFIKTQLISVSPKSIDGDSVITTDLIGDLDPNIQAVVIRTLPNLEAKKSRNYSNTNPPYIDADVMVRFRESGINHLLIDLPSVDKEKDNGALLGHKAFWNFNGEQRLQATITELVYIPDEIQDGLFMMDLQVAPIENDAAPSRPVLYQIH